MMARPSDERKLRTREHVIADLSHNHLERFILEEGHYAQRTSADYGYDLSMQTFDEKGRVEPGLIYWQLKASESLDETKGLIKYDVDVRDYNLWMLEQMPVILVLYDVSARRAYWIHIQGHFSEPGARRPRPEAKTVRVQIPTSRRITRRAIRRIRALKQEALDSFTLRAI
jgi:hypothetical protein